MTQRSRRKPPTAAKANRGTHESRAAIGAKSERHRGPFAILFLAITGIYLATVSDQYFGLISDRKDMFYTAVSFHEFGELGIGPEVDRATGVVIQQDRYSKYGLGFPAVLQFPLLAVVPVERFFGPGQSNVLFPMTNMLITAATALVIALCIKDLGARLSVSTMGALGFSIGTFAWPYISYDFRFLGRVRLSILDNLHGRSAGKTAEQFQGAYSN